MSRNTVASSKHTKRGQRAQQANEPQLSVCKRIDRARPLVRAALVMGEKKCEWKSFQDQEPRQQTNQYAYLLSFRLNCLVQGCLICRNGIGISHTYVIDNYLKNKHSTGNGRAIHDINSLNFGHRQNLLIKKTRLLYS